MNELERHRLAAILRERREALDLSARELARKSGVDQGNISLLERARVPYPRVETIQALARALGVPLADLYADLNWLPENALPSLRPYMRAKYESLSDADLRAIEDFVDGLGGQSSHGPRRGEDE